MLNILKLFGQGKPDAAEALCDIGEICRELQIRKPHQEYDEGDIYIEDDELKYMTTNDLIASDLSDRIWVPVQFNGKTCRLQIDDLIARALKTEDPEKVRAKFFKWMVWDGKQEMLRYGNDILLRFEFYRDIICKKKR